jgi:hypothetical protein
VPTQPPEYDPAQRCDVLAAALIRYHSVTCPEYDEILHDITGRVAMAGSLGKTDLGALLLWKRIQVGAWAGKLLCMPDSEVREITAKAVAASRDQGLNVPDAARAACQALLALPGTETGDALASAVILAAAPERMAVYDYRAHLGLWRAGLRLEEKPGLYYRYMGLVEQCRAELLQYDHGTWTAREVDLALFTHGQHRGLPRPRPWWHR